MSAPSGRLRADLALAFIAFIWGSTFVVVKGALGDASTMLFLTLRFSLAAVALGILYRGHIYTPTPGRSKALRGGVLAGLLLITSYFCQTHGLRYTSASNSAFITGLCVVFVPIIVAVMARRLPIWQESVGVLMATVGMGMMTIRPEDMRIGWGDLLTLGCAVGFALHLLVVAHYSKGGFELLSLTQVAVAALAGWATFWWTEPVHIRWSTGLVVAVAITGLLATALAFTVMTWAQRHTTATHTALLLVLEPVFALITSWIVEGERLSRVASGGAVLILAGILIVELKPFRRAHAS